MRNATLKPADMQNSYLFKYSERYKDIESIESENPKYGTTAFPVPFSLFFPQLAVPYS
jgi:hypothetical protein